MGARIVDLHSHSSVSDGSDSPVEVVLKAHAAGLSALALTDHDSLDGNAPARAEAEKLGLEFIPGIEIAVRVDGGELHLLGLWMPEPSRRMREFLEQTQTDRQRRNQAILDALQALGMPLVMDEVRAESGKRTVGRPHIALAMRRKGYTLDRSEAFKRYLGWGARAFVPRVLPSPEAGIALLRNEGATVALAHPCLSPAMTGKRLDELLATFRSAGLEAVEAYHSAHGPDRTRLCVDLARRHGLLLTGGSDYHGLNKPGIALGCGHGALRIPYGVLERLKEHRARQGLWI